MGLAGLRQNDNPAFAQLASTLLFTGSNVLVEHPLINIENIDMCARNYGQFLYPAYAPGTTYGEDTSQALVRVKYGTKNYRSKVVGNIGNQPDISPDEWEEVNLLSAYLEDLFASANLDAVVETFNRKKINLQTKTLLRSLRLYEGAGNHTELIVKEGALVGVEILVRRNQNLIAIIEKVGLQLSQAQDLTLRLYHSSSVEPVGTLNVTHTKVTTFEWHTANMRVAYNDGILEPGGVYYLMYDENDLAGQAIRKRHNFNVQPCAGCGLDSMIRTYNLYNKYLNIRSVKVAAAKRNGVNLWDITQTQYVPDTNFGINLEVTAKCDLTAFLIQQKDVFKYAVRDTIIFKLLTAMANSTRQNTGQDKVALLARNELTAAYAGGMGFMSQLDKQLKAVDIEISALDETCMPCARKSGLGYGTASLSYGQ